MKPSQLKKLSKELKFSPKKTLGQNFLINKIVVEKLIRTAKIQKHEIVVEVGPGLGFITEELVKKCKKVIAIEIDKTLCLYLKKKFQNLKNLEIINKDVLQIDFSSLGIKKYKVVGSLPYTGALLIIRRFLEERIQPVSITAIVQKEVAKKICSKKMSLPKAAIEVYGKAKIVGYVPKTCFYPQPKVDGAILSIFNIHIFPSQLNEKLFFKLLKAGFAFPRKTLVNNLTRKLPLDKKSLEKILKENHIDPHCRPENLSLENWINLSFIFQKFYDTIIKETKKDAD